MMKKLTLFVAVVVSLMGCAAKQQEQSPNYADTVDTTAPSLREDIGTMIVAGFRGTSIDSTHHIWRDIKEYHIGGVILFDNDVPTGKRGRNIQSASQMERLCSQLHALSPTLLIGIDQEGGKVSRLSSRYGFPAIPSAQETARGGMDSVRHYAAVTADMLASLGINLNFAPVADVDVNPDCPVIGRIGRSFSADEQRVADCCGIWLDEQRQRGVVGCLKHFPGHGSAKGDTHQGMVDVSKTWQQRELEPYRQLIASGKVQMVMTAHVINRRLDPSGLPASLSPMITSYLRDSLGFNGVIITDDLAMGAIAKQYSFEETLRLAIIAGADLLCLCNNGPQFVVDQVPMAVRAIERMVERGEVSAERIHQSAERIRALTRQ